MYWSTEAFAVTGAPPSVVFAIWTDVSRWKEWDHEVTDSKLHGEFEVGINGTLKPRGGPSSRFTLSEVTSNVSFSDVSKLPFTTLEFEHTLVESEDQTTIYHKVTMRGPLTFLFRRIIGRKIKRGLPVAVSQLARIAETASARLEQSRMQ